MSCVVRVSVVGAALVVCECVVVVCDVVGFVDASVAVDCVCVRMWLSALFPCAFAVGIVLACCCW